MQLTRLRGQLIGALAFTISAASAGVVEGAAAIASTHRATLA
jgi:hypothetical protein